MKAQLDAVNFRISCFDCRSETQCTKVHRCGRESLFIVHVFDHVREQSFDDNSINFGGLIPKIDKDTR